MFCTECGQEMADNAKFCAYCGTRRVVTPTAREAAPPPPPPPAPRIEVPPPAQAPAPVRPARSTAEIMAMPVRPVESRPPVAEPVPVEFEPLPPIEPEAPWPERESAAPPMTLEPEPPVVVRQRPARPAAPPPVQPAVASGYASVPFAAEPGSHDYHGAPRKVSPVLIGAIIVALIALGGIFWMVRSTMSSSGKSAGPVTITIYPTSAKVAAGKSVDFVAEVTGAPSSDVTWTVDENQGTVISRGASAKGDSISLYCTYSAPSKAGTYHLTATSTADKLKSATADITVTEK